MGEFFNIDASKYDKTKHYIVTKPSSLNNPKDNSVMFITEAFINNWEQLLKVKNCIVLWPKNIEIPNEILVRHAVILCDDPRKGQALLYQENNVTCNAKPCEYQSINGAFIAKGAKIGENTIVFPGAYIDSQVTIGNDCYIGSGVKLIGHIDIGNNVIIRENTVIGSDGLTRMRDDNGRIVTIPQFGGVVIEDDVQIGALTVIAKGAIDNTIIRTGCRIDNCCFISHNVQLGENSAVVGESILFGSVSTEDGVFISGNSSIRDGVHIGKKAFIGMSSNVVDDVKAFSKIMGNPAK